jgi:hypothetical protein
MWPLPLLYIVGLTISGFWIPLTIAAAFLATMGVVVWRGMDKYERQQRDAIAADALRKDQIR